MGHWLLTLLEEFSIYFINSHLLTQTTFKKREISKFKKQGPECCKGEDVRIIVQVHTANKLSE